MVQPGCYLDPNGCSHIFPDEVIAEMMRQHPEAHFDFTPQDLPLAVQAMKEMMPASVHE